MSRHTYFRFRNEIVSERPVSAAEKILHDRIAQLGCISCRADGHYNNWVSIHHVHGRTRLHCHMYVLPLCEAHHQNEKNGSIAVHVNKARWEERYGDQDDLVAEQWASLGVAYEPPGKKSGVSKSKYTATKGLKAPPAPKPERPPKQAKPSVPKRPLTKQQEQLLEHRKAEQKKVAAVYVEKAKASQKERRAQYLEDNKDAIEEQKDQQRQRNRDFRKKMREANKLKKAS